MHLPPGTRKLITFDDEVISRNAERSTGGAPFVIVVDETDTGPVAHRASSFTAVGGLDLWYQQLTPVTLTRHIKRRAVWSTTGDVYLDEEPPAPKVTKTSKASKVTA